MISERWIKNINLFKNKKSLVNILIIRDYESGSYRIRTYDPPDFVGMLCANLFRYSTAFLEFFIYLSLFSNLTAFDLEFNFKYETTFHFPLFLVYSDLLVLCLFILSSRF